VEANGNLDRDWLLEFPILHTERAFKAGDYIRVRHGVHAGVRGHVVDVGESTLKVIALRSDNLEFIPNSNLVGISSEF
jgi:small-conductance mechanosensitive channel